MPAFTEIRRRYRNALGCNARWEYRQFDEHSGFAPGTNRRWRTLDDFTHDSIKELKEFDIQSKKKGLFTLFCHILRTKKEIISPSLLIKLFMNSEKGEIFTLSEISELIIKFFKLDVVNEEWLNQYLKDLPLSDNYNQIDFLIELNAVNKEVKWEIVIGKEDDFAMRKIGNLLSTREYSTDILNQLMKIMPQHQLNWQIRTIQKLITAYNECNEIWILEQIGYLMVFVFPNDVLKSIRLVDILFSDDEEFASVQKIIPILYKNLDEADFREVLTIANIPPNPILHSLHRRSQYIHLLFRIIGGLSMMMGWAFVLVFFPTLTDLSSNSKLHPIWGAFLGLIASTGISFGDILAQRLDGIVSDTRLISKSDIRTYNKFIVSATLFASVAGCLWLIFVTMAPTHLSEKNTLVGTLIWASLYLGIGTLGVGWNMRPMKYCILVFGFAFSAMIVGILLSGQLAQVSGIDGGVFVVLPSISLRLLLVGVLSVILVSPNLGIS